MADHTYASAANFQANATVDDGSCDLTTLRVGGGGATGTVLLVLFLVFGGGGLFFAWKYGHLSRLLMRWKRMKTGDDAAVMLRDAQPPGSSSYVAPVSSTSQAASNEFFVVSGVNPM